MNGKNLREAKIKLVIFIRGLVKGEPTKRNLLSETLELIVEEVVVQALQQSEAHYSVKFNELHKRIAELESINGIEKFGKFFEDGETWYCDCLKDENVPIFRNHKDTELCKTCGVKRPKEMSDE